MTEQPSSKPRRTFPYVKGVPPKWRELWLAVGALLTNAEDPKHITTKTAMCGKYELANLQRAWKRAGK